MKFLNRKGNSNSILIVVIIAAVVAIGLFAYLNLNTTAAFVTKLLFNQVQVLRYAYRWKLL